MIKMPEAPLFRFAIISDTHIRPSGESSSPWKTNLMTNDRARWIARKVDSYDPDLVVHLGDIVHPVPHLPTYGSASDVANQIMEGIRAPVYYVPGNHDIGDKDNPTVPAYIVNEGYFRDFRKYYGSTYQSFDYNGIHFVLINSPVLNSGLPEEKQQKEWLERDLKENKGKRILVFSHYPPYLYQPDEAANYDNIDLPERMWLLELLKRHNVEAFFAGHVHQFGYKRYHGTQIYKLFSTCFVRQDFSEMFRVEPADEFGRNDAAKLGYCVVDVYSEGLKVNIYRSFGETLGLDDELRDQKWIEQLNTSLGSPLGVHLRHSLTETMDLPYMGPIDEFVRKRTRNDYPVLGLWETGIKTVRIPLEDLRDEDTSERLYELHEFGHRFMFFTVNVPDKDFVDENRGIIDLLEVILPWEKAQALLPEVSNLREYTGVPVYVANIESSIHRKRKGPKFSHYICHGFHVDEAEELESILPQRGLIDGFVFQVDQDDKPLESIKKVSEYAERQGFNAVANVRLGSEDPAEFFADDDYVAGKSVEAVVASYGYPNVMVFLDTFVDHDRGYFPRVGLYDRRINPRKGAHVVRNLNIALQRYGSEISIPETQPETGSISFNSAKVSYRLHKGKDFKTGRESKIIDLVTGEINPETVGDWCLIVSEE